MLTPFGSIVDVLYSGIVFIFGFFMAYSWSRYSKTPFSRVLCLYIWHTFFSVFYIYFSLTDVADATTYYLWSLSPVSFSVGTDFVVVFLSFFSSVLGFGYVPSFLVFNIIGSVGLFAFYSSLRHASAGSKLWARRLVLLIVFLPSASFWSVAIGKDSIAFMATGLALWAALDLKHRNLLMAFSILAMFMVRPHIAGIMVLALCISYVMQSNRSLAARALLIAIGSGVAALAVPFAINYAGLSQVSPEAVSSYIEARQSYNQDGGGGVDISSMSFPMQLFTYLFRPLSIEARSVFQLAASLDNVVLLIVFLMGVYSWKNRKYTFKSENTSFLVLFSLGCWVVLALTTANLGISVRQKWMFLPMIFYVLVSVLGRDRKSRIGGGHMRLYSVQNVPKNA
ncbi:hypothetical protein [Marinobacter sp. SS5-14b]|uniref:hypothetical protein n=1 Tax=Marinobacter sp. SS5-14b TaxID=3050456 RepID=UPI0026E080FA|nr:hypothetical protein [Marinobacter sp. SS5-14b]